MGDGGAVVWNNPQLCELTI